MKYILIALLGFSLKSCGPDRAIAADEHSMTCKYVASSPMDFHRCENSEVICYASDNGLSCRWKGG